MVDYQNLLMLDKYKMSMKKLCCSKLLNKQNQLEAKKR